jgi:hypothetical protein
MLRVTVATRRYANNAERQRAYRQRQQAARQSDYVVGPGDGDGSDVSKFEVGDVVKSPRGRQGKVVDSQRGWFHSVDHGDGDEPTWHPQDELASTDAQKVGAIPGANEVKSQQDANWTKARYELARTARRANRLRDMRGVKW